jgi:S-adenosylmethionine decarboxylase
MNGLEWIVEAHGCNAAALTNQDSLEQLFGLIVAAMDLHPLGKTSWHQFPNTGGITGVSLLSESHLACHTFPEYESLCLNVFCCRPRDTADFEALLKPAFGPARVSVRQVERPY